MPAHTPNERPLLLLPEAGGFKVRVHVCLGIVVGWRLIPLIAFVIEPAPPVLAVLVIIFNLVHRQDPAGDKVIEEHADGSEVLLHSRLGPRVSLAGAGDVGRLEILEPATSTAVSVKELVDRSGMGQPGALISDVGREELDETLGGASQGFIDRGRAEAIACAPRGRFAIMSGYSQCAHLRKNARGAAEVCKTIGIRTRRISGRR
jgi:hypothetical protein